MSIFFVSSDFSGDSREHVPLEKLKIFKFFNHSIFIPILLATGLLLICSCQKENTIIPLDEDFDPKREIAENVEMIFSDSAKLEFIIKTPRLEKYKGKKGILVEEFPKGIHIDFYNHSGEISSSLYANYAERRSSEGTMLLRDSVVLNNGEDQLTTIGVMWNEQNHTLKTSKFVQMVQGASGDTMWGYGLEAKDDFSRFRIRKLTGKRRYQETEEP